MKETRHLGVYGLIVKDNKIALILKSRGAYTGKLDLPGGSIEHGERPEDTLVREIKEELDADVKEYELFDTESVVVDWTHHDEEENGSCGDPIGKEVEKLTKLMAKNRKKNKKGTSKSCKPYYANSTK